MYFTLLILVLPLGKTRNVQVLHQVMLYLKSNVSSPGVQGPLVGICRWVLGIPESPQTIDNILYPQNFWRNTWSLVFIVSKNRPLKG